MAGGATRRARSNAQTWRYREYRSLDFDAKTGRLRVCSSECLWLTVDALDVEAEVSREPGGYVRRRVGKVTGIESDKWLDQKQLR